MTAALRAVLNWDMEEKQVISYQLRDGENSGDEESGGQWEPSFQIPGRPPGPLEKFKLALAAGLGLLVFAVFVVTFFFVGLILSVPVILLGIFGAWRLRRNFRRFSGFSR